MGHLLVTNDFPPKVGGIQTYLWDLWSRLPADEVTVLTTPHPDAPMFDAAAACRIERVSEPVLLPTPATARRIRALADEVGAGIVLLDPALPIGALGPALGRPYGLVLHGAEVTVPGRTVAALPVLRRTLRGAALVVAAGGYPLAEGERAAGRRLPSVVAPPGVDTQRFHPLGSEDRATARRRLGLDPDAQLVVSVSRLVPRKGMDVLIDAAAELAPRHPRLRVAIAGAGRDEQRLARRVRRTGAPVVLLGRIPGDDLPGLYAAADVFAMLCRNRWAGLEQEGFGIVFLEAAAAGVAQVAGRSGGAHEAVVDGETGFVVDAPHDVGAVAGALAWLLDDPERAARFGAAARARAVAEFDRDRLAARLHDALRPWSEPRDGTSADPAVGNGPSR